MLHRERANHASHAYSLSRTTHSYYCRWDGAMHPHQLAGIDWIDDWGTTDQVGTFERRKTRNMSMVAPPPAGISDAQQAAGA